MRITIHGLKGENFGEGRFLRCARGIVAITTELGVSAKLPITINSTYLQSGDPGPLWLGVSEFHKYNDRPDSMCPSIEGSADVLKKSIDVDKLYDVCATAGDNVEVTLDVIDGNFVEVKDIPRRTIVERTANFKLSEKAKHAAELAAQRKAADDAKAKDEKKPNSTIAERAANAKAGK